MSDDRYELIVVGLGAMGGAALFHAASRGIKVLGIDRHHPPHSFGSSHAESRITRLAIGEGEQYLPFVARAHDIWRDLEERTGAVLLHQPGGYIVHPPTPTEDDRWGGFVYRTDEIAKAAGIEYHVRTAQELTAHLPNIIVQGDEAVGFEPTGGIVMCERAVATQLELAAHAGAATRMGAAVTAIEPAPGDAGMHVHVGADRYTADKVIVATGAWFPELAPQIDAAAVSVTRQACFFFEVDDPAAFSADHFPFFLWPGHTIEEYSAIFPMDGNGCGGLKILGEQFHETTSAETVSREVTEAEIDDFYERLVVPRVKGVRRKTIQTDVCLYTNTVDDHFLIDHHPATDRVLLASPCSGHGFKHSTALGEAMVELITQGSSALDLAPFARKTH